MVCKYEKKKEVDLDLQTKIIGAIEEIKNDKCVKKAAGNIAIRN